MWAGLGNSRSAPAASGDRPLTGTATASWPFGVIVSRVKGEYVPRGTGCGTFSLGGRGGEISISVSGSLSNDGATMSGSGTVTAEEVQPQPVSFSAKVEPAITAVEPDTGPISGGTRVKVVGTGFVDIGEVSVGGSSVVFTVKSPVKLILTTPPGTDGNVNSQVISNTGSSSSSGTSDQFTYSG
jgi:IPT/TIG domain